MRTITVEKKNKRLKVVSDTRKIKPFVKRVTPRKKKR